MDELIVILLTAAICIAGAFVLWQKKKTRTPSYDQSAAHAKRYDPTHHRKRKEIDRILDKAAAQGMDALTSGEKELLRQQSQKEKARRQP